ncbi:MAG TPA: alpha/beta hydrolase [Acidimicrobiia bacterium]
MTPIVLVHGGGLDRRCWDPLLPHLEPPAIAVDLPGRGAHPAPLDRVTFADCAEAVRNDVDGAAFDEILLVGHSLAGCSMPATIGLLGDRVRHAVFVACTVPDDGTSSFDMLDPDFQQRIREMPTGPSEPRAMDEATARIVLGTDLTEEQFSWCSERLVPEAPRLNSDPVDLSPLHSASCGRTWVRTLQDIIVSATKQVRYAENVGDCPVVDLDAGHMCMVSQPENLAAILNRIAAPHD